MKEGADQVEHSDPAVDRFMHVLAEGLVAIASLRQRRLSGFDAPVEGVLRGPVQQMFTVREVPIERADADFGSTRNRIERGFAADLED
ncbi:MAG TPA: hypothetical protein VM282_21735 [Acidimicrobiales bacterium]|nr:hypothetical protein [Acidimicrobiales bacterium]